MQGLQGIYRFQSDSRVRFFEVEFVHEESIAFLASPTNCSGQDDVAEAARDKSDVK